jgi:hydrogenase expression/formation protein HypC
MCLAVPGKLVEVKRDGSDDVTATGTVDFQGSRIEVGLALTPEAEVGDWLLIHAGYALNVLDEQEARETWDYLQYEQEIRQAEQADESPME